MARHSRDGGIVKSDDDCLIPFIRATPCHSERSVSGVEESLKQSPANANVAIAKRNAKPQFCFHKSEHLWALPTPTKGFPPLETDKEMIPLTPIRLQRPLSLLL